MQLSTPIQTAPPTQLANPYQAGIGETEGIEGLSSDSPDYLRESAEKKNAPGIFARLLESLSAKRKAAESGAAEKAEGKLLPETKTKDTLDKFLQERLDLFIEQAVGPPTEEAAEPPGQAIDQQGELPSVQPTGLPIDQLVEMDDLPGIESLFVHEGPASIGGELHQDDLLGQAEEGVFGKERELAHSGNISQEDLPLGEAPRVMAHGNESLAGGAEALSSLPFAAELAKEEFQPIKTDEGEGISNSAAKKARAFADIFSRQADPEVMQARHELADMAKPSIEEGKKGPSVPASAAEARGKKGREKVNVEFIDLRTEKPMGTANVVGTATGPQGQAKPEFEIQVDLSPKAANSEAPGAGSETLQSRAFEEALAAQLRGGLATDIVRDATIIARNGGEGTIKLTLHPASLGNVKVSLEMAENKITALIVVESDDALKAFQRELPVLEKAFKDSGFGEANLQMALAQDQRGYGSGEGRRERDFPGIAPITAAARYEADQAWAEPLEAVQGEEAFFTRPERTSVNILI